MHPTDVYCVHNGSAAPTRATLQICQLHMSLEGCRMRQVVRGLADLLRVQSSFEPDHSASSGSQDTAMLVWTVLGGNGHQVMLHSKHDCAPGVLASFLK